MLSLKGQGGGADLEYACFQHMERTRAVDSIDRELGCVRLRWIMTDEVHHSLEAEGNKRSEREHNVGKWFVVQPLSSILCSIHVV